MISTDENQIKLYYSSETSIGKQTYAFVVSSEKKVLGIDISKTKVPGSHWVDIADALGIEIQKLINRNHPDFIKEYGDKKIDLEQNDWLLILEKHPETLAFPVVIMGHRIIPIHSPSDFVKYMDPDSTNQENPD
ncbi:arsenate reductase family protein [Mariniflexile sp. AS56]|uniref:arsenate reductase family protein n=1 Tax=Mariniflexile sp. AS56 TaxID=3063957 RepID=UPI0026EE1E8C|nr:hypothetical protein [Mariniflexile sp. AS56]MDO7172338.1 hypothetical protein [Mariniflexile sp. AS56]